MRELNRLVRTGGFIPMFAASKEQREEDPMRGCWKKTYRDIVSLRFFVRD